MFKNKPQFYNKYIVDFFFLQIAPSSGYFFGLKMTAQCSKAEQ